MTETTATVVSFYVPVKSSRRWHVPLILEVAVLAIGLVLPAVLQDYLTVYATRVLILCLFPLSFDLVWGYAGIMSFGQAVFFGSFGYCVSLLGRRRVVPSILLVFVPRLLGGLTV